MAYPSTLITRHHKRDRVITAPARSSCPRGSPPRVWIPGAAQTALPRRTTSVSPVSRYFQPGTGHPATSFGVRTIYSARDPLESKRRLTLGAEEFAINQSVWVPRFAEGLLACPAEAHVRTGTARLRRLRGYGGAASCIRERRLASLSIPGWNQIAAFLQSMQRLRDSVRFAAWQDSPRVRIRSVKHSASRLESPSCPWVYFRWFRYATKEQR